MKRDFETRELTKRRKNMTLEEMLAVARVGEGRQKNDILVKISPTKRLMFCPEFQHEKNHGVVKPKLFEKSMI
jgi:hypothetical protein